MIRKKLAAKHQDLLNRPDNSFGKVKPAIISGTEIRKWLSAQDRKSQSQEAFLSHANFELSSD